jgi:hypothetical protein
MSNRDDRGTLARGDALPAIGKVAAAGPETALLASFLHLLPRHN